MSGTDLFRQEVINARRGSWLGTVIVCAPTSRWLVVCMAVLATTIIGLLLAFGEYASQVHAYGRIVEVSSPLSDVMSTSAVAELSVSPDEVSLIQPGNRVAVHFDRFASSQFAQQIGRVTYVSKVPQPERATGSPDGRQGVSSYAVRVILQGRIAAADDNDLVEAGMTVDAEIRLEKHRLIYWVLGPLGKMDHSARVEGSNHG